MFQEKLRHIKERELLHSVLELHKYDGYGTDDITGISNGTILTFKGIHVYQLACGHRVTSSKEVGGSCVWCFVQTQSLGLDTVLLSLHCKLCIHRCAIPLCRKGVCETHGINIGETWLCPLCFSLLQKERSRQEFKEEHGVLGLKAKEFIGECFFNDK